MKEKGQTLIEVLAAFGVAVVLVAAIAIAVVSALSNAQFSKNQNLATQYAQQGMEIIRQMRNNDFAAFNVLSGDYCLDKNSNTPRSKGLGCGQNIDNIFVREVGIEKNSLSCPIEGSDETRVTVSTSWSDSKCTDKSNLFCHSAKFVSCLSNVNVVATPGNNPIPPTPTSTPAPTATPRPEDTFGE